MIHKLLTGKGRMKKVVSLLLCLALLGGSVISSNVTAEAESEVTEVVETVEEEKTEEAATVSEEDTETVQVEATEDIEAVSEDAEAETIEETDAEEATPEAADEATAVTETEDTTTAVTLGSSATVSTIASAAQDSGDSSEGESGSEMPAVTLKGSADGVDVSVDAPEGAFAEGVSMVVSAADVAAFEAAVLADCEALGDEYTAYDAAAVEISFYVGRIEVQPAAEVEVTLSGLNLATTDENGEAEYALIYHMDDDGNVEWIADKTPGEDSYTFTASSFSAYGVVNVSVGYGISTAATTNESITVAVGYSETISADQGGQGDQGQNTTITSYSLSAVTETTDGVTVTSNYGGGKPGEQQLIQSLTVTGATAGTIVTLTVNYSNGDTVIYTITVIDPADLTVDHIDIDISTTAVLYINGVRYEVDVTLTKDDYTSDNVTLTAAYEDGTEVEFDWDLTNIDTSSGSGGESQLRVSGTYPIGTEENPVYYTITLTKDVTFTVEGVEYTVTVTFTSTFSYWDDDNVCPGLGNNWSGNTNKTWNSQAGMDFALGTASSTRSVLTIYKYVYDTSVNLLTDADNYKYTFNICNSSGVVKTVTLTVHDGIAMYTTDVDPGSYYVIETDYVGTIGSYTYKKTDTSSSYITEDQYGNENTETKTTSTLTTETMTVSSDGTTIYTINNYYEPSTTSITVSKQVTGNMGDTTKEFDFTLTLSDSANNPYTGDLSATKTSGSLSSELTLTYDSTKGYYSFTLADDETIIINSVPYGYTYVVNEADYISSGYETTVTGSSSGTATGNVTISYVNDKTVEPDTGINLDSAPYILMLAGVAILGGVVLFRRRRRLL